jgi:hypothetical protein
MSPVRVGSLSPAKQQKIIANVRAGQAAFNQLKANLRREEQLMNNIEKLAREKSKVERLSYARPFVHPENSNANRRNTAINTRLERNVARKNQEIRRQGTELIALRRRLLGAVTRMSNHNIFTGVNYSGRKANINRMQMKRLSRLITNAYLKPGGMYSRKLVSNVQRVARGN